MLTCSLKESSLLTVVGRVAPTPHETPLREIAAAFLSPVESPIMEHAHIPKPGWHGFRFAVGQFDPANQQQIAESDEVPDIPVCTQEKIGFGCYHTAVDFDQLDQQ